MDYDLKIICERFIKNQELVKSNIKWADTQVQSLCALLYTEKDLIINENKIQIAKEIFKKNIKMFSNFNGYIKNQAIIMMSMSDDPENMLLNTLNVYSKLKEYFSKGEHLALAALLLTDVIVNQDLDDLFTKSKALYKIMKKNHRFITSN